MAKRHLLMLGLLLVGGALSSVACSDAKIVTIGDGDAGATGEAGSKGEAGATGEAGAKSEGGSGGEGGEAPFEYPPSLNPQAVIVVGPAPSTFSELLVGGTDYASTGEIVSITLGTGAVGDSTTYQDGDTHPTSSAGVGFAIERRNDQVHLLTGGKISTTFDLTEAGGERQAVEQKAYVPLYNQSFIAILDLSEGKVSSRIDLNEYNAPGDSDRSADIAEGVYDPSGKIAYFLLQRIDLPSYNGTPNLPCSKSPALIVGVDTDTDEVVDLNGDAEGKALELKLVNPRSLSINSDGTALYLLGEGCYEGTKKISRGVEVVDLTDGTTTVAYEAAGTDYLASMILTGGSDALIQSFDDVGATHWTKLDIAAGTLGAEIENVPSGVTFDGTDLIGVEVTGKVGKVVRYDLATETSTTISATSWAGNYSAASGTALVQ